MKSRYALVMTALGAALAAVLPDGSVDLATVDPIDAAVEHGYKTLTPKRRIRHDRVVNVPSNVVGRVKLCAHDVARFVKDEVVT